MVRCADTDSVNRWVLKDIAEISNGPADVLTVEVVDLLRSRRRTHPVTVANRNNLAVGVVLRIEKLRDKRGAHLNAVTNHSETALLTLLKWPQANLIGGAAGKRCRSSASEEKITTVDIHFSSH